MGHNTEHQDALLCRGTGRWLAESYWLRAALDHGEYRTDSDDAGARSTEPRGLGWEGDVVTENLPALELGAVLGGGSPGGREWGMASGALHREAVALSAGLDSPVRLEVHFHVDGRIAPNEFEGVRTGRFSRTKSKLWVQAAIPGGVVEDRRAVLLAALADAVDEAERYVIQRRLADGLPAIQSVVAMLRSH